MTEPPARYAQVDPHYRVKTQLGSILAAGLGGALAAFVALGRLPETRQEWVAMIIIPGVAAGLKLWQSRRSADRVAP